jgi:hypothetical protein
MKMIGFGLMLGAVAIGWAGMIYGWGLTPQSWPWIIGSSAASMVVLGLGQAIIGAGD